MYLTVGLPLAIRGMIYVPAYCKNTDLPLDETSTVERACAVSRLLLFSQRNLKLAFNFQLKRSAHRLITRDSALTARYQRPQLHATELNRVWRVVFMVAVSLWEKTCRFSRQAKRLDFPT